ncbi:unnamed protein product [Effrenium voratum]|nr:unnamed protein product [Effrenium voratum]
MPPKFAKKLSASGSKDLALDSPEPTPGPKDKSEKATPLKRPAAEKPKSKGKKKEEKPEEKEEDKEEPVKETSSKKRKKKEGPYTCFKEKGSIPEPELPRNSPSAGGGTLFNVLAWNVGSLRAFLKTRIGDLQEAVKQGAPHVLGFIEHKLQEGVPETEAALKDLVQALPDYEVSCVSYSTVKKAYSGTMILLHKDCPKPLQISAEDLPSAAKEGRLVVAEFEHLYVVLCYVPNSGDGLKRLTERIEQWDVQLKERLLALAQKKQVVLMGDLNVAHRDQDIWNAEAPHVPKSAGTTAEERESFGKLLESGFKDGFCVYHPEALGAFTYWSVRAGNRKVNRGLRLDYVLVSESLVSDKDEDTTGALREVPRLCDAFHLPSVATGDHCPVGAVFLV